MNESNLDIKFQARKHGVREFQIAHYLGKSYSWLLQILRFELKPQDKQKFFNAINAISRQKQNQPKGDEN